MAKALDRDIRKILKETVRKARLVAEDGARKALTELGVEDAKSPEGLSAGRVELRNRLRAHAKSLDPSARQADESLRAHRLVREIAYEHWHRALFARFLAENGLLLDPDSEVAVRLSELEEIAKEEQRDWTELAGEWAEPMLPQIFRQDDPALALCLPPETRAGLADLVKGLPKPVFEADDSLGWVYQFWQADKKDEINRSGAKIGADELPAVTQLFTEDYMVLFLLENTLGAWWAGKILEADPQLARDAVDEDELRVKTSPPGYRWTYLRFVRESEEANWRPAAGTFSGWPRAAKEITVLDPCMGSGHFLVFALPILIAFRRAEEKLDEADAVRAVLADNLHGLEIDPRCTQIAAFALAMAAWKRMGGVAALPPLHLACSGLAIGMGKAEFLSLADSIAEAEGWTGKTDLLGTRRPPLARDLVERRRAGLARLYDLFEQAPFLGSLIDPRRAVEGDFGDLFAEGFDGLSETLGKVLAKADASFDARETAVAAQGIAKAAELLGRRFTLVATNVPYLTRGSQGPILRDYIEKYFEDAGPDIATALLIRFMPVEKMDYSICLVSPWGWFFKDGYKSLRRKVLEKGLLNLSGILGSSAFESISGEEVSVTLTVLTNLEGARNSALVVNAEGTSFAKKASSIAKDELLNFSYAQASLRNGFTISLNTVASGELSEAARYSNGIQTSDYPRCVLKWWEVKPFSPVWEFMQSTTDRTLPDAGLEQVIRWENGHGDLHNLLSSVIRGQNIWRHQGVAVSATGELKTSLYRGHKFDESVVVLTPIDDRNLAPLWALASEPEFNGTVRKIDSARKVRSGIVKVPFDVAHWQRVAAEKYPHGLPKPTSNDPTQWLFEGHPHGSADPNILDAAGAPTRPRMAEHPLQVAVARLVGYRWPRQTGSSFMDCPAVTEPDEVDRAGVIDADGVVCLPALFGEAPAAERLRAVLAVAWGPEWREDVSRACLEAEGAKAGDLEIWLADEFFEGHCKLFHQTPFVWHVWDGAKGGFSALVNSHKLCEPNGAGRRLLEKLRDTYLGEWIATQRRALAAGEAGAEDRLLAAEHLRDELDKIIEGEPPHDIFVRWKPLSKQPIGWEPDVDDGVRLNIRPFLTAKTRKAKSDKACLLRVRPNLKWGKDRGVEPPRDKADYPWFWGEDHEVATVDFAGGEAFRGFRHNDFHYTRAFKEAARAGLLSCKQSKAGDLIHTFSHTDGPQG